MRTKQRGEAASTGGHDKCAGQRHDARLAPHPAWSVRRRCSCRSRSASGSSLTAPSVGSLVSSNVNAVTVVALEQAGRPHGQPLRESR
jgi:hypothetical protein